VRRIPDTWLADYPTEPWGQIKGIGNRLRHEYFRVDDAILWQVMTVAKKQPNTINKHLDVNDWQVAGTKKAIASLDRGEGIPHDSVKDWVASWGHANEKPVPEHS
jgi:predicted transcriptional regulator